MEQDFEDLAQSLIDDVDWDADRCDVAFDGYGASALER